MFIPGEEENTAEYRERLASAIIASFNSHAVKPTYKYPKHVKFGGDFSSDPLVTVDTYLLDQDVIGLMQAAYPDNTLLELKEFPDIMEDFWGDPTRGAEAMDGYEPSFDPGAQA